MIGCRILLYSAALAMTSLPLFALDRQQSNLVVSQLDGSQKSDDGRTLHPKKCSNGRRFGKYTGKQVIKYKSSEAVGTIIIDTCNRVLYVVQSGGMAIAYGVGVGRRGFRWSGTAHIKRKAEWPAWHPPKEMIKRELRRYRRRLPDRMEGGPNNPLGARALYLYQGETDTLYRIHGTNAPRSIGQAVSSGCVRLLNDEVIDLYDRIQLGTKVIVF